MHSVFLVDAFTSERFRGNPAAVCLLAPGERKDDDWMQAVASELNQSETAFVRTEGHGLFSIRWFTPIQEEVLCGHATLAAAHVLWESGLVAPDVAVHFDSASGLLCARKVEHGIELDFPAERATPAVMPASLALALGCPVIGYARSRLDHVVEVADEQTLRALKADVIALAAVPGRGVAVTAESTSSEADFYSRYFALREPIPEDPVTGSAHCTLGPFWAEKLGKN